MKGVILAGGTGTRLLPLTRMINKHLLPVGEWPMICYGIEKLKEAGICDILLIISKQSAGLYTDFLGSGSELGVRLTYKIQENAGGIAQALELARDYVVPGERLVVLLGDNLFLDSLKPFVDKFAQQPAGSARVLLKRVDDPERYGVPVFAPNQPELIAYIEEKPQHPKSDFCVTGIYMYDDKVFDHIAVTQPSSRGELEITDVNNLYASEGKLEYDILQEWWTDAGTFESLHAAAERMKDTGPEKKP